MVANVMNTATLIGLIEMLIAALHEPHRRKELLAEFQSTLWETENDSQERWKWEILRDLAHDLDFYEPDSTTREEDPSYFDDKRAEEEIRSALKKLSVVC